MRGTRTAAHNPHDTSTATASLPQRGRHCGLGSIHITWAKSWSHRSPGAGSLMADTLHGLHAGVYPVYRGRISTAHQGDRMNEYEQAIERMEAARANLKTARIRLTNAEDEMAAERNLMRHEERPGIPLPQYRPGTGDSIGA
jgi:hypothetical protein